MSTYMEVVKLKHGYQSLKSKYYEQLPYLGGAGNFGMDEGMESWDEAEVFHKNPIEEKDNQIAELRKALEDSKKEVSDITVVKETLIKTRSELQTVQKLSNLAKNKLLGKSLNKEYSTVSLMTLQTCKMS